MCPCRSLQESFCCNEDPFVWLNKSRHYIHNGNPDLAHFLSWCIKAHCLGRKAHYITFKGLFSCVKAHCFQFKDSLFYVQRLIVLCSKAHCINVQAHCLNIQRLIDCMFRLIVLCSKAHVLGSSAHGLIPETNQYKRIMRITVTIKLILKKITVFFLTISNCGKRDQ